MIICLKNLTRNHSIAILTSIHQPNNDVLRLFDQLYVLSIDGQCIYNDHPTMIKEHLIKCQIPLMNYHVLIEELIKIASKSDSNNEFAEKLIKKTFEDSISSEECWIKDTKLLNKNLFQENKSFNFSDAIILLRRTFRNELIGGWKIQFVFLFVYFISLYVMLYLFPNDIGTDPGCTEESIDLRNISLINQRILDAITGNEQKFQQNIKYIFFVFLTIMSVDTIQLCYMFSCQNHVSLYFKKYILLICFVQFQVFLNEHRNQWYSTGSYFWSKNLFELIKFFIIDYICLFFAYYGVSEPDVMHWHQAFYQIPHRFLQFFTYTFIGMINLNGNLYNFKHIITINYNNRIIF